MDDRKLAQLVKVAVKVLSEMEASDVKDALIAASELINGHTDPTIAISSPTVPHRPLAAARGTEIVVPSANPVSVAMERFRAKQAGSVPPKVPSARSEQRSDQIRLLAIEKGTINRHDVAQKFDISPLTADQWMQKAIKAGLIKRVSRGVYCSCAQGIDDDVTTGFEPDDVLPSNDDTLDAASAADHMDDPDMDCPPVDSDD